MIQEDARLIRQVLDGNADAYEHLVRANEKNVYNLALKMTGNEQDAMDLAQDAFLKAYTNLGKFNGTCMRTRTGRTGPCPSPTRGIRRRQQRKKRRPGGRSWRP